MNITVKKLSANKAHAADCKKWHAIFAFAKAAPLFATADVRRYGAEIINTAENQFHLKLVEENYYVSRK